MDPGTIALGIGAAAKVVEGIAPYFRKKGKFQKAGTPEDIAYQNWARDTGKEQIQNPYKGFEPISQRARSQFNQHTAPSIANRLNQGSGAALSSPQYQQQTQWAQSDLEERLAGLQAEYGLNQQRLGQGLAQQGLQNFYQPETESATSAGLAGLGGGIGQFANMFALNNMMNPQAKKQKDDVNGLKNKPLRKFAPSASNISRMNLNQDEMGPMAPDTQGYASSGPSPQWTPQGFSNRFHGNLPKRGF